MSLKDMPLSKVVAQYVHGAQIACRTEAGECQQTSEWVQDAFADSRQKRKLRKKACHYERAPPAEQALLIRGRTSPFSEVKDKETDAYERCPYGSDQTEPAERINAP